MWPDFSDDDADGARILFVGLAESTHSRAWIDLLRGSSLNVRLFAIGAGMPPADWPVRTYLARGAVGERETASRRYQYPGSRGRARTYVQRVGRKLGRRIPDTADWFAAIMSAWRPHVVHTLG